MTGGASNRCLNRSRSSARNDDTGFEQGPIRPPSEARSLLIRVTRNCPWNRCTFCPVYKGMRFSRRPVEDIQRDIDTVARQIEALRRIADRPGKLDPERHDELARKLPPSDIPAFTAAVHWLCEGRMRSVFLQDADTLIIKTPQLVQILTHLRARFPEVERITSYARSQSVCRKPADELQALADAGLNRIHIGLESGSDEVLRRVEKGVTKDQHIEAGRKVRATGIELSEYVMPGLGGRRLSEVHTRETADALNQIDPDFVRIRSLTIPPGTPLADQWQTGAFDPCSDLETARELAGLVGQLEGIHSTILSDHVLNLLQDVRGRLPRDQGRMLDSIHGFLGLAPEQRMLYQIGRRAGLFSCVGHLEAPHRVAEAEAICRRLGVTPDNVDAAIRAMTSRFV